jgi:hypothetical protein
MGKLLCDSDEYNLNHVTLIHSFLRYLGLLTSLLRIFDGLILLQEICLEYTNKRLSFIYMFQALK